MAKKKGKKKQELVAWPAELKMLEVEEVATHPDNPRVGNKAKIKESIQAHGFIDPIVVQKSSMYVLAGNHRLVVAKELGYTEVPARVVDMPDDKARKYVLAANKASDEAGYNEEALAVLLTSILDEDEEDPLAGTAYSAKEAETILARAAWQDEGDLELPEEEVETHKGEEATGAHKGPKPQDRTAALEALQRRSLILSIPVKVHAELVDAMKKAREDLDVNTTEEMIVELLKKGGYLKKKFRIFAEDKS